MLNFTCEILRDIPLNFLLSVLLVQKILRSPCIQAMTNLILQNIFRVAAGDPGLTHIFDLLSSERLDELTIEVLAAQAGS